MYYVQVVPRGRGAAERGSPKQALDYISDPHGEEDEAELSHAEVAYIARLGDGWKTELEGGRVPLHGLGLLAQVENQRELRARFDDACLPYHDKRATTGYKSVTFTLPREMSLVAEGHRAEARELMAEAVRRTLDRTLKGFDYTGVTALHTRNENGEVHFHMHVLIAKFGHDHVRGKTVSINNPKFGWLGRPAVRQIKEGWKEHIDQLFKERFDVTVEQKRPHGAVTLTMPDGTRLEALNRDSRRVLDIALRPLHARMHPDGHLGAPRPFELKVMDDEIYEIAAARASRAQWNPKAFQKAFPEKARFVNRYEKRVESLKAVGYLTADGSITPAFRIRYSARKGAVLPELQALRLDLAREMRKSPPVPAGENQAALVARYRAALEKLGHLGVPAGTLARAAAVDLNDGSGRPYHAAPDEDEDDKDRQPSRRGRQPSPAPASERDDDVPPPSDDHLPPGSSHETPNPTYGHHGEDAPPGSRTAADSSQPRQFGGHSGRSRNQPSAADGERFWNSVDHLEALRLRLERLGLPHDQVKGAFEEGDERRPTPNTRRRTTSSPAGPKRRPGLLRGLGRTVIVPRDQVTQDMEKLGATLGAFFEMAPPISWSGAAPVPRRPIFTPAVITNPRQHPDELRKQLDQVAPIARAAIDDMLRQSPDVLEKIKATRARVEDVASTPGAADAAARLLVRGLAALRSLRPQQISCLDNLDPLKVTTLVLDRSQGRESPLTSAQFKTAVQAGRVGRLLDKEERLLAAARGQTDAQDIGTQAPEQEALTLLRSRLAAMRIHLPLPRTVPARPTDRAPVESLIAAFQQHELLGTGPAWTLRRAQFLKAAEQARKAAPAPESRKR